MYYRTVSFNPKAFEKLRNAIFISINFYELSWMRNGDRNGVDFTIAKICNFINLACLISGIEFIQVFDFFIMICVL